MASPLSLSSVITPDSDIEKSKPQEISNTFQKESNNEVAADGSTPSANTEIPQWKKDLIQRRRINIAKTMAANQSVSTSSTFGAISTVAPGTSVMALETKASLINAKNNNDKLTPWSSNTNAILDTKNNTSQHSLASAANVNLTLKMPGMLQQHDDFDSPCGGHYTPVNNKSSGLSYNYTEKLADRTLDITQEEQAHIPQTRSFSVVEQYSNEGSSTLLQENVQFRKNLTEQHEAPNTTSADSLLAPTSRLSSGMKVAVAAENYKKSNKDNFLVCVSEHKTHTLQEPALTTHVSGGNNGNDGVDDEQPLHHQLKCGHEVVKLVNAGVDEEESLTKFDSHLLKENNNTNSVTTAKASLNKKQCGLTSAEATSLMSTSCFVKNQKINSTLVSSHHNYKINTKYRLNQNSTPLYTVSAKSSVIESPSLVTNNKKKMVAVQEMNEISNNELDFDPSEELQYGPGIVSKLRCRYLSLALRQATGKQRLSMRRATSLNNLLDDNDIHDDDEEEEHNIDVRNKDSTCTISDTIQQTETKTTSVKFSETIGSEIKLKNIPGEQLQYRSRHIKRGNDSLKRARSVEALLCEKSPWNFTDKSTVINNNSADSVTIEDKINHARDRLLLSSENPPKRLTSIIDDTERPPPDVVKQTLKIFEASANRRGRGPNRNSGGEVATKVANYKSIITQNKPIITFPKPPVSPKKTNLKNSIAEVKKTNTSPPTTPNTISLVQSDKNALLQSSTPATSSRTIAFRQKMDLTPIRNASNVCSAESLSENSPDIIPRHKPIDKTLSTVGTADTPVTQLTKRIEHLRIESPTVVVQTQQQQSLHKGLQSRFSEESSGSDSEDDSVDGEYEVNKEECEHINQITKSTLEDIGKAGTSQQFQFQSLSNGNSVKFSEPLHDIPTLSTVGSTTVKQIGVIRPLLAERKIMEGNCGEDSGDKHSPSEITSTLTSREIEKNRINNEKKIEKPAANSQINELYSAGFSNANKSNVSVTSKSEKADIVQPSAWSAAIIGKKKRTPSVGAAENNTMVFNFKDRKEVPDYIENDGLIFKRKRELPKPNESGYVMLGDLSLETSTDPEDEWPVCPPSPCDVEFENANIIIDGKSSIKNRSKEIHFRVQFDDSLTSTFEYPSETSVINDTGSDYPDLSMSASLPLAVANTQTGANKLNETDSPIIHHHVAVDEIIQLPHNNKVGNLSLGSAPLGSYTPVKAKIDNVFQLGVTRVPTNNHSEQSSNDLRANFFREQDDQSLEYIKPASDDLTIAYSEGSLKTDLLY